MQIAIIANYRYLIGPFLPALTFLAMTHSQTVMKNPKFHLNHTLKKYMAIDQYGRELHDTSSAYFADLQGERTWGSDWLVSVT